MTNYLPPPADDIIDAVIIEHEHRISTAFNDAIFDVIVVVLLVPIIGFTTVVLYEWLGRSGILAIGCLICGMVMGWYVGRTSSY